MLYAEAVQGCCEGGFWVVVQVDNWVIAWDSPEPSFLGLNCMDFMVRLEFGGGGVHGDGCREVIVEWEKFLG